MGNDIGIYGLGVMGQSLARNAATKGFLVSAFNIDPSITVNFTEKYPNILGYEKLEDFVNSLEKPRKIILMVTAGTVVDAVLQSLIPVLDQGDIVIDCGNSFYKDTERRQKEVEEKNLYFLGCGVSGGEKGAFEGPSMMPSGNYEAYRQVEQILTSMAAKHEDGSSCCCYIGQGGAGHFVKMVHNGIEYADMQLIAEFYAMLKVMYQGDNQQIRKAFIGLCKEELASYLLRITIDILAHKEGNQFLIDQVVDVAKQKGTGKWTSQVALEYGVAIPSLNESVQARFLSEVRDERVIASKKYHHEVAHVLPNEELIKCFKNTMFAARMSLYAQGFSLIQKVSDENSYGISMAQLAHIWKNGCIIKSNFLDTIEQIYRTAPNIKNMLLSDIFVEKMNLYQSEYYTILDYALRNHLYIPVLTSACNYIHGYASERMETNLIQAQRDCFGAHGYEKIDEEGTFHTDWQT